MVKSRSSKDKKNKRFLRASQRDKEAYEIVSREIERFRSLVKVHEKLLEAIGNL